ncbi:hypothetical protein HHK36_012155 [Tetracentron sinense]|uniref:CCHC-type domain-containing protein n=1 Tax=Tetracentron sinense TaxID=13715 RepID=A0A834ZCD2_TETSI|nr:hypothetical protein HHK36_012155 [Tetracentron sinense]
MNQPWNFNGNLIVLQKWEPETPTSEMEFVEVPFWVQFHGLPLEYMTHQERLARELGEVLEVDMPTNGVMWGKFLRVRVVLKINIPLRASLLIQRKARKPLKIQVKYERLPTVCYECGMMGHDRRYCPLTVVDSGHTNPSQGEEHHDLELGPNIRAEGSYSPSTRQRSGGSPQPTFNQRRQPIGEDDRSQLIATNLQRSNVTSPQRCHAMEISPAVHQPPNVVPEVCMKSQLIRDKPESSQHPSPQAKKALFDPEKQLPHLLPNLPLVCHPSSTGILPTPPLMICPPKPSIDLPPYLDSGQPSFNNTTPLPKYDTPVLKPEPPQSSPNRIEVEIQFVPQGPLCRVSFIYGPIEYRRRYHLWNQLAHEGERIQVPWLLTGDFNDILTNDEKEGGKVREQYKMQSFQQMVSQARLIEIEAKGPAFTWCNHRQSGQFIQARLDRAMGNPEWCRMLPDALVFNLDDIGSDHRPVIMLPQPTLFPPTRRPFRFVLEGDASQLMDVINKKAKEPHWDVATILKDVSALWLRFPIAMARSIPRSANGEAHQLAKRALYWRKNGTLVGFCYDVRRNSATSPFETISFLKKNRVSPSQIRVFVADHRVLGQLSNTGVPVHLYLNETEVENLRKRKVSAISWLKSHLMTFLPHVNITSIIVSTTSSDSVEQNELTLLLSTLKSIHSVLSSLALESQVKVSVAFSVSFLKNLNRKHARDLREIVDFIEKYRSFIVLKTIINGELRMGDRFVQLMIKSATSAATILPHGDASMVLTVSSSAVPSAVEVAEFTAKIARSVENNTRIIGKITGLSVEISPIKEFEQKEFNQEEQIFPSYRRELLYDINHKRTISITKISHDVINPPTTPPPTPITNPVTTPVTIPTVNPVPSNNPVTITPTNPATSVPIPSTTPITVPSTNPVNPPDTVPVTNPVTTPVTNPVTTYSVPPPGSIPITTPVTTPITNPVTPPSTTNSPTVLGQTWCVAKTGALESAIQTALDYACGIGGADCSTIQQTGSCYNPNTLQSHASYAFNSYYQKNPVPSSCDFGGTAMVVNTNPSSGSCIYPSSSSLGAATASAGSSSSVLNTSNPTTAATTIFGSEPLPAVNTSVSISAGLQPLFSRILLVTSFVTGKLVMDV